MPRLVRRRELDIAHRRENECERGRGRATRDLEHDAKVAGDNRDWTGEELDCTDEEGKKGGRVAH